MKKTKNLLIISITFFILFLLLILLVKTVDVKSTGIGETVIGLSKINFFVRDLIGKNIIFYTITDWLGIVGPLVAFCYAMVGLVQWIKRKNMFKVDAEILILGCLYLVIIATYFFFEFHIINYRPVLLSKKPEASFPSSHTLTTCTILITSIFLVNKYFFKHKIIRITLNTLSIIIVSVTIIGRIISGVHWITDIFAGIFLIVSFSTLYLFFIKLASIKTK